ncbi:MAG: hypothetical protein KH054_04455, partial [Firmicutes bacterium]|nr:hypothetical protein [Bacillota bacterium]
GVGIKSINLTEEGKLHIVYTDDSSVDVDVPTLSDTCEHTDEEVLVVREHTLKELGIYLHVCNDCGFTSVEYASHHHYEETTVAPTCTEEGYTAGVCTICGDNQDKHDIVEALGHVWGEERIVVEEGRTLCENGGMIVHTCEVCGVTEAKTESAMGHDVKEWMEASAPTLTKGGEIYGACERCGKKVTKALPALNEKDYTYTVIKAKENCSDTGEVEYTYTVDENNSFTYKVTLSPSSHKLHGKEMPDDKTYDSQKYPDIKVPVNVDHTCAGEGVWGVFVCDECGELVSVRVRDDHTYDESTFVREVPATCTTEGYKVYLCKVCGVEVEVPTEKLGHDFVYGDPIELEDGTYILEGKCSRCGETDTIKATKVEKIEATCMEEGKIIVTYVENGTEKTKELSVPKTAHKLNGELMPDDKTYDSKKYPGIKVPANVDLTCSGEGSMGVFYCDVCGELVMVKVKDDHKYDASSPIEEIPATCTEAGSKKYLCEVCGEEIEVVIEKLGHDFVYGDPIKLADGTYILRGTCSRCGETDTITAKAVATENATCQKEGRIIVTYMENGAEKTKIIVLPKTAHTHNGELMPDNKTYDSNKYPGIKVPVNVDLTCSGEGSMGVFYCDVCGELVTVRVRNDHKYTAEDIIASQPATCTENGWVEYKCSVCGETIREDIKATGHAYSFQILKAPTADAEGSILVLCSKCDHQDTIVLPALDAKNYQVTVTIAAGCQSEGEAIYVYTDKTYGYTYKTTVVLPMLGHTEYVEGKTKTYTWIIDNAEYTGYICETCGQMIVVNVTELEGSIYGTYEFISEEGFKLSLAFHRNGTFEFEQNGISVEGTWSLQEDGTYVLTTDDGSIKATLENGTFTLFFDDESYSLIKA